MVWSDRLPKARGVGGTASALSHLTRNAAVRPLPQPEAGKARLTAASRYDDYYTHHRSDVACETKPTVATAHTARPEDCLPRFVTGATGQVQPTALGQACRPFARRPSSLRRKMSLQT